MSDSFRNKISKMMQDLLNDEELDNVTVRELRTILVHFQDAIYDEQADGDGGGHEGMSMSVEEMNKYVL